MLATAVLITREKEYPKEVLDSVKPHFDEVLIETECKSLHRRYDLALKAKNSVVYVQDDDCVIDVLRLFKAYNGELTNAITQHHKDWYDGTGVTLVGFGCFFPKRMVDFKPYLDRFGANPLFLSQADRIFTYLNRPHNSVVMPIRQLDSSTAPDRMSSQPDHYDNLDAVLAQLNSLQINR